MPNDRRAATDPQAARDEASWFCAFATASRLSILRALAGGPLTIKELAAAVGAQPVNTSLCVGSLRRAGVVAVVRDGRSARCSLAGAAVGRDRVTFRHPSGRAVTITRESP